MEAQRVYNLVMIIQSDVVKQKKWKSRSVCVCVCVCVCGIESANRQADRQTDRLISD